MKKALKFIAGVLLLMVPLYFSASLPILGADDFFSLAGLAYLTIFLAPMFAAVFLTPKLSKVYLILISAVFAFWQFGSFDWVPLAFSCATLLPLALIQRGLFRRCLLIPALSLAAVSFDAFAFKHRYAVHSYATVHSLWDMDPDPEILRSPSGKTTAYVLSGGFLDAFDTVCISDGRLLPLNHGLEFREGTSSMDIITRWEGPVFFGGNKLVSFAYDERTKTIIDENSFRQGGMPSNDERTKSPEALAEYLLSLPSKVQK
jgi:hypothetical protein